MKQRRKIEFDSGEHQTIDRDHCGKRKNHTLNFTRWKRRGKWINQLQ